MSWEIRSFQWNIYSSHHSLGLGGVFISNNFGINSVVGFTPDLRNKRTLVAVLQFENYYFWNISTRLKNNLHNYVAVEIKDHLHSNFATDFSSQRKGYVHILLQLLVLWSLCYCEELRIGRGTGILSYKDKSLSIEDTYCERNKRNNRHHA